MECFLRSFSWIYNIFGKLTYIEIGLLDFRPKYQSQLCFKNWLFRYISTSYKAIALIFKSPYFNTWRFKNLCVLKHGGFVRQNCSYFPISVFQYTEFFHFFCFPKFSFLLLLTLKVIIVTIIMCNFYVEIWFLFESSKISETPIHTGQKVEKYPIQNISPLLFLYFIWTVIKKDKHCIYIYIWKQCID